MITIISISFAMLMAFFASLASVILKISVNDSGKFILLLKNKNLYHGIFLYFLASIINIILLQFLPYSVVVPMGALTYVWTILVAHKLLNESYSKSKLMGVMAIFCGITILSIF